MQEITEAKFENVLEGERVPSAILVLNFNPSSKAMIETKPLLLENQHVIARAREAIIQNFGAIEVIPEQKRIVGIFNRLTLTKNPELDAAKAAIAIQEELKNSNFDFGIGIEIGELVIRKKENRLNYFPLQGVLTQAKKMANNSKNSVLISSKAYFKISHDVVASQHSLSDNLMYSIKSIKDRSQYKQYVDTVLKRIAKDEAAAKKR